MSDKIVEKTKENIEMYIKEAENMGLEFFLVESNEDKGFNFPYLVLYPKENLQNLLIMDCLNDYEEPMIQGEKENTMAVEEVCTLFKTHRIARKSKKK